MAAFDRICSGIPAMDSALDNIRLGDNVVWRVSDLEEFRELARPFAAQAIRDGRNLIYVRFAEHEPILEPMEGLRIVNMKLTHLFETSTININNRIEREGKDGFYVFDCLSDLEEAWATDILMGDFFHLTCPFLFQLDTVAYFPVLRGRHSFDAIEKIQDTTQLFFDVFPCAQPGRTGELYVRPIKVWNRNSPTMFHPHKYCAGTGEFRPLSEGVEVSQYYAHVNLATEGSENQNMDSWERFFQRTKLKYESGIDVSEDCSRICDIMLTRDDRMRQLIKQNFLPKDYFEIHSRMVGTGMIGGKACGMLLSRKITENKRPDIFRRVEPHDSFSIGSDDFYSYIVDNGFWDLKIQQKTEEGYFSLADSFAEKIMQGVFPPSMERAFRKLLDYYGNDPVIVRSSSILEDGFGNAFAGKYESVFCANNGDPEERLQAFEQAVRTVYASTMSMSALDYRKRRGLDRLDEQMALLVQRVSGSRYDDLYMPCAAGVGYSMSPYRLGIEHPEAGMLRLVAGLGTAAVDRRTGSYPRIVALDNPSRVLLTSSADRHQFSQRLIDAVSNTSGSVESFPSDRIQPRLPDYQTKLLFSHDWDAERAFRDRGIVRPILFTSCEGLVQNKLLMEDMHEILSLLQAEYDYPVDIEFTINVSPEGEHVIDLLQCRPLQMTGGGGSVSFPEPGSYDSILLETKGVSMGFSRCFGVDVLVYVDAIAYYKMPYVEKFKVKTALSAINWKLREQNKRMLLITPGRICTSSAELGVPSAFADISEFDVIIEVSESRVGYMPELSYGSHIFQDLVEAGIRYSAVFEEESTLHFEPGLITAGENRLSSYMEHSAELESIVYVLEGETDEIKLYYDMPTEHLMITKNK
ncbi:MAG: phosphoenolpyruvate synthase [Oscillospiraceae bacterium]|nr:phosphoenolpyruvate synthase [Oscillospiraceae bacterium]